MVILYFRNKGEWRKCKKNKTIRKRDKKKVLAIIIIYFVSYDLG